jgi:hypothetical protein
LLNLKRAGESDVGVQMAFVKLVKADGRHPAQRGIGQHLTQQNPLGYVPDARCFRVHFIEPDLVADFATHLTSTLLGNARSEHSRRQSARLQHDYLAFAQ